MIRQQLLRWAAFTRIPGNAFSFWVRRTLRWSRGKPELSHDAKDDLFAYLDEGRDQAQKKAAALHDRYQLAPLAQCSTAALYRKNLYLLDALEQATHGLPLPMRPGHDVRALDIGSQDWYYVFALERWLRHAAGQEPRQVQLTGIELDGYEIYADFRSRFDYAQAYLEQTGNPLVRYEVGDFLQRREGENDCLFLFYPLVMRYQLLLWGLPLRYFAPQRLLAHAATLTRPGGWLVVFCHHGEEQRQTLQLTQATGAYELLREGRIASNLVKFGDEVNDNRYSVWRKKAS